VASVGFGRQFVEQVAKEDLASARLDRPPVGDDRAFPKSTARKEVPRILGQSLTGEKHHVDMEQVSPQ
jgi:hypothetical protein